MSMPERIDAQESWRLWGKYAVYFVCWVAFVALSFYLLMRLRVNILLLMEVFQVNRWARSATINFSFVILGLVGLSLIIIVENYLRTAVLKNLLLRRAINTLGATLILLLGSFALQRLLELYLMR